MMFDALSMLAHAASEAAIEPHEAFVESPREAGSAPSSTSIDSASTMTFSPQLKHQTLERECPPVRHLRETTEENQAPAIEDEARLRFRVNVAVVIQEYVEGRGGVIADC